MTLHSTSLRVATANIQNFDPNLTEPQVRADAVKMREVSGLIFWQEIAEEADHRAIRAALGADWQTTEITAECPISWRKARFRPVGDPVVTKVHGAVAKYSPARYFTRQRLAWRGHAASLPDVLALGAHYTQGGWAHPPKADLAERREAWRQEWTWSKDKCLKARASGRIVITGADWNRKIPDIPLFAPDQEWLAGHTGIDAVAGLVPAGVTMHHDETVATPLNSDHDGKSARVTYTWKTA